MSIFSTIFSTISKLLSGGEVSFEKKTHTNPAQNLLTNERAVYVGEWQGDNTNLLIKPDGSINYRTQTVEGDSTNTQTVSGPINNFNGANFTVGVLGNNTHFNVANAPHEENGSMTMTVNGKKLVKR